MSEIARLAATLCLSACIVAAMFALVWVGVPWLQAAVAGAHISLPALVRAWARRLPIHEIVTAYVVSKKGGVAATFDDYVELRALGGSPIRAATMLAAMRIAGFPYETRNVLDLETRGDLAAYMREWQRSAARGQPPPELPRANPRPD